MHRCLIVEELLVMFLRYRPNDDVKAHRATLAAVARTAKIFFEPAVGILWEEQDGLDNLLRCLPGAVSILERVGRGPSMRERVSLDHMPLPYEWANFDYYAHQVKTLLLSEPDELPVQSRTIFHRTLGFLNCRLDTATIFPRLTSLTCFNIPDDALHYIPRLVGPSLCSLTLVLPGCSPSLEAFLTHIVMVSPYIQHLEVSLDSCRGLPAATRLPLILAHFSALHDFTMKSGRITVLYEELAAISRLPLLNRLEIDLAHTVATGFPMSPPLADSVSFASLTTLDLANSVNAYLSVAVHADSLRMLPPAGLRRLRITNASVPHPDALKNLFVVLSEVVSHQSLEWLEFEEMHSCAYGVSIDILKPLMSFSNLVHLDLQCNAGGAIDLTDSSFELFANSWPRLEHFVISDGSSVENAKFPTLGALVTLIRCCPDLRVVSFTLDAILPGYEGQSEPAVLSRTLDELPSNNVIEEVDLIAANITTVPPSEVAAILLALLPNLKRVLWENAAYEDEWGEVEETLEALRAARSMS